MTSAGSWQVLAAGDAQVAKNHDVTSATWVIWQNGAQARPVHLASLEVGPALSLPPRAVTLPSPDGELLLVMVDEAQLGFSLHALRSGQTLAQWSATDAAEERDEGRLPLHGHWWSPASDAVYVWWRRAKPDADCRVELRSWRRDGGVSAECVSEVLQHGSDLPAASVHHSVRQLAIWRKKSGRVVKDGSAVAPVPTSAATSAAAPVLPPAEFIHFLPNERVLLRPPRRDPNYPSIGSGPLPIHDLRRNQVERVLPSMSFVDSSPDGSVLLALNAVSESAKGASGGEWQVLDARGKLLVRDSYCRGEYPGWQWRGAGTSDVFIRCSADFMWSPKSSVRRIRGFEAGEHLDASSALASPDGRWLAARCNGAHPGAKQPCGRDVFLIDWESAELRRLRVRAGADEATALRWAKPATLLVRSRSPSESERGGGTSSVWNAASGERIDAFAGVGSWLDPERGDTLLVERGPWLCQRKLSAKREACITPRLNSEAFELVLVTQDGGFQGVANPAELGALFAERGMPFSTQPPSWRALVPSAGRGAAW